MGIVCSFLRNAPQHVFDCVGEGGEADDDEQVSERSSQESVVTVDLREVRGLMGGSWRQVTIQAWVAVLCVVGVVSVRDHVRERKGLGARAQLLLRTLLLIRCFHSLLDLL